MRGCLFTLALGAVLLVVLVVVGLPAAAEGILTGGIRAAAFAQAEPGRVARLALCAFTYKGKGAAEIERRQKRIAELRASPRRKRDAAMIASIFARDGHPEYYDPAMIQALVADELQFGNEVPSGTYLDMAANMPVVRSAM